MENRRKKLVMLAVAGGTFLLHSLGMLSDVVLLISGVLGVYAAGGLVVRIPAVKTWLRRVLR